MNAAGRSPHRRAALIAGAASLALLTSGCGWIFKSQRQANNNLPNGNATMPMPRMSPFPPVNTGPMRVQLQPGQYEFRIRNELLAANGFSEDQLAPLREQLDRTSISNSSCVTPQETQSSDYGLGRGLQQAGCQSSGLRIDNGGRMSGVMGCNFQGVPAQGEVNGLVTRDSVFLQLTISATPPGDTRNLRIRTEVNATRTGNCAAGGYPTGPGNLPPNGPGTNFPPNGGGGGYPPPNNAPQYPQGDGGK